ncbi:5-formyltetrahydrofolate cyclo-ligase [Reichenbachiella sp. MALMAid0571]|uniref:5-formyltetrahydrofolate cyclo-ligase n=1 Tax=Reichenbachiella sp. MALMAid0571 TaxID=3143939 RepID=UPI0032DEFB86
MVNTQKAGSMGDGHKKSISGKALLRATYLEERRLLPQSQIEQTSKYLLKIFERSFDLNRHKYIHVFLPIEKQNEVNTWHIVEYLERNNQYVVISKSDLSSNNLEHFIYDKSVELKSNKWGIPEPESGVQVSESQIDMVLIPLLIFDKTGHRVGYGKGYYDLFLSKCRTGCVKVGLSLMPPVDLIPETEPTDVRMDYCISPLGLHTFETVKK